MSILPHSGVRAQKHRSPCSLNNQHDQRDLCAHFMNTRILTLIYNTPIQTHPKNHEENDHKHDSGVRQYPTPKPTHTLVPCWMPKLLTPRNQCTGGFPIFLREVGA